MPVVTVTPGIPLCSEPGQQPLPAVPKGPEVADVVIAQADALLAIWAWADRVEPCLAAMRAAGRVRP